VYLKQFIAVTFDDASHPRPIIRFFRPQCLDLLTQPLNDLAISTLSFPQHVSKCMYREPFFISTALKSTKRVEAEDLPFNHPLSNLTPIPRILPIPALTFH
jgi:hypothetical protein